LIIETLRGNIKTLIDLIALINLKNNQATIHKNSDFRNWGFVN